MSVTRPNRCTLHHAGATAARVTRLRSGRAAAAVGAVVLLTAGCTSGHPGQGVGGPTTTGPHSSAATSVPTATTGASPSGAQTTALLAGLRAVDPALVADEGQAVRAALVVCAQLQDGGDAAGVVPPAFTGVDLTGAQAAAVAAVVESSFCPV